MRNKHNLYGMKSWELLELQQLHFSIEDLDFQLQELLGSFVY